MLCAFHFLEANGEDIRRELSPIALSRRRTRFRLKWLWRNRLTKTSRIAFRRKPTSAEDRMMRHFRLWVYLGLALSGLALSGAQPAAAWGPREACYPVASWVTVPPNVCF